MDGDHSDLGTVHEGNVDIGPDTSNNLDLNVEQNCCSPNIVNANCSQSGLPSTDVPSTNTVLGIGTEFESDDHAYRFYNRYARLVGFNVRKDWTNRSKVHGQVVSRKFTCSKEGYRKKDKRDVNVKKHRKETRTGCLAHMIVTRQLDGKYKVTHFEAQHNHDNINPIPSNAEILLNLQTEFSGSQAVEADSNNNLGPKSSHFVKDAESFAKDLWVSIYDPKDEEEFTHAWEAMLEKYNLQKNEWLKWMYREREKWAVVFGRNTFFVDLKGFHLVDEQRYKEIEASDEMSRCLPRLMGNVVLLKHASDVYTPRAFEVFQRGYEKSLNVLVNQHNRNGSLFEYKANTFGHTRQYSVTFNSSDDTVVCSCMKFEHVGFLCSHALKVLDNRNIKVVPSRYILKRWTKDARLGNLREISQCKMQDNPKMAVASCYKDLCHRLVKLSARASESVEAYQFAARQLDEVMEGVEKILTLKVEEAQVITPSSIDVNASESEPAEIFLNGHATEDQDESNRVNGEKDRRATPARGHQTTGLYSFEANQGVHCVYEQPNSVLDHQSNTNMFQPPNFFSNQQNSPGQSQILQEPIIQNTYHESMPSNNQMRQGMDLDIQNPHSSSFLLYDHRYRSSDSA
ncbi:Zinc finger, PMZ-type [Sesbania bispinosa]|nr:Zinc finger, PMZ-type [Sesbania bispinosa]